MEQIFPGIYLLESAKYDFPYCNCLWIEDSITCMLDSSPDGRERAANGNRAPDLICNSHGHIDHWQRNISYQSARVLMHPNDRPMAASRDAYLEAYGFSHFPDEWGRSMYLTMIGYEERPADGDLEDGQVIQTGRNGFVVLHLPGHTPGHCGFFFPGQGLIFSGDITLDPLGPWYGNIRSSVQSFIESVERIRSLQPEMIVPGHGRRITRNIERRLSGYSDFLFAQGERVMSLLRSGPRTIRQLAAERIVYQELPAPRRYGFLYECTMVWKQLEWLRDQGRIFQDGDIWGRK